MPGVYDFPSKSMRDLMKDTGLTEAQLTKMFDDQETYKAIILELNELPEEQLLALPFSWQEWYQRAGNAYTANPQRMLPKPPPF